MLLPYHHATIGTDEILASPQHMDHPFEYLIDAAFAAQFQPTKQDTIFNLTHDYAEYQYQ